MANTIEIVIRATDKASATITSMAGKAGVTVAGMAGVLSKLDGPIKSVLGLGSALQQTGVVQAGQAIYNLGKLGAQSLRTSKAFENISGGAFEAASRLDAMREATRGAMTEQELMSNANLLMQMGLANNSEELGRMTEMATKLGSAMGAGPNEAISSFAMMLANQSLPRLDMFGISSGNVRKRIEELQKATVGLTREQAFNQAVMEEGAKAMQRLGDSVNDPLLAFEQLEAQMANTKTEIAMKATPAIAGFLSLVNRGMGEAGQWGMRMKQLGGGIGAAALNMVGAKDAAIGLLDNMGLLDQTGQRVVITTGDLGIAYGIATGALQTTTIATQNATIAQDGLATSGRTVAGAFGEMQFDNESLWNLAMASGASVESLALLADKLGIASDAEIAATIEAYKTVEAFGAGTLSADQYAAAMTRIGDAASEAAAKADRLAQLAAGGFGAGGAPKGYQHGTSFYPGGMGLVGERGPEMVALPRGSQIYPSTSYSNARTLNDQRSWNVTVSNQAMAGLVMNSMRQQRLDKLNQMM